MLIRAFITHKKAEHFSDCQDRFSINPDTKSIAVSDGMTQSIFQKYWAQILVEEYTSNPEWVPNLDSVRELSTVWLNKVQTIIEERTKAGDKYIWRGERKLSEGQSAGATFLGIRFKEYNWECDVLGDTCLILIRDNNIEKIISSEKVDEFDNYPDYYDSNPNKNGRGTVNSEERGTLKSGDIMLMVTDPFSDFLLKNSKDNIIKLLVHRLLGVNTHKEFEEVVEEWRGMGMHNDDSTLIIIEPDGSDNFTLVHPDDIEQLISNEILENESLSKTLIIENVDNVSVEEKEAQLKEEDIPVSNQSIHDKLLDSQFEEYLFNFFCKEVLNLTKPKKISKNKARIDKYVGQIKKIIIDFLSE